MAGSIPSGRRAALPDVFDRDALELARDLLGKVIRHRVDGLWLSARIIETEAYYQAEKGSHASLGYTHKRRALFMDGGVIYMYYARGGDSLNFSAAGPGNAVLIKSGHPWVDALGARGAGARRRSIPTPRPGRPRTSCAPARPCRALGLKVPDWDARRFDPEALYVEDVGERPAALVRCAPAGHSGGPRRASAIPLCGPGLCRVLHPQPVAAARSRVATMSGWMGGAGSLPPGPA